MAKAPTIQQLVDVIKEYNRARELELRVTGGLVAEGYKNELMDELYEAAVMASRTLKAIKVPAISLEIPKPIQPAKT